MLHSISGDLSAKLKQINLYTDSRQAYRSSSKVSDKESSREWKRTEEEDTLICPKKPKRLFQTKSFHFDVWKEVGNCHYIMPNSRTKIQVFKGGMCSFVRCFWQLTECKATQEKCHQTSYRERLISVLIPEKIGLVFLFTTFFSHAKFLKTINRPLTIKNKNLLMVSLLGVHFQSYP